ncbi:MAG: trypsin-like serine protease, partial [Solirubrobacteraceae bacterium]|nr:trypsin-like serine protease [Solirubrobacteraceae bacterium]
MPRCLALLPMLVLLAIAPAAEAIKGGADAPQQPQLVSISIDDGVGGASSHSCGGVIRDATHVLTAAHCLLHRDEPRLMVPSSQLLVIAGDRDLNGVAPGRQVVRVAEQALDPRFTWAVRKWDVALLTLATPLALGPAVQAASLPAAGALEASTAVQLQGWGLLRTASDPPGPTTTLRMQQTPGTMLARASCGGSDPASQDVVCVTSSATAGVCAGDSGTGLLVGGTAYGVMSIGSANCTSTAYYTRLAEPSIHAFAAGTPAAWPEPRRYPAASGLPVVGQPYPCDPGDWTGAPTLAVGWDLVTRGAPTVRIAEGATYTPSASDVGKSLRCVVTATGAGGTATVRTLAVQVAPATVLPPG